MLFFLFLAVMSHRSFPVEDLKFDDAALSGGNDGGGKGFRARVTNNSPVGAKNIRIRIDIFDKNNKRRIDGAVLTLYDRRVPAGSTILFYPPSLPLSTLPADRP